MTVVNVCIETSVQLNMIRVLLRKVYFLKLQTFVLLLNLPGFTWFLFSVCWQIKGEGTENVSLETRWRYKTPQKQTCVESLSTKTSIRTSHFEFVIKEKNQQVIIQYLCNNKLNVLQVPVEPFWWRRPRVVGMMSCCSADGQQEEPETTTAKKIKPSKHVHRWDTERKQKLPQQLF